MQGKILLFGTEQRELLQKLKDVAAQEDVQLQPVALRQCDNTVGQIALMPVLNGHYQGVAFSEPMMVLCVRPEKLDSLLAALKKAGLPPVCKAVLTPTNAGWMPHRLLAELQHERAAFEKMK